MAQGKCARVLQLGELKSQEFLGMTDGVVNSDLNNEKF